MTAVDTPAANARAARAIEHLSFLAEAGMILSSALDYQSTLDCIARLLVPRLADMCTLEIMTDNGNDAITVHVDPELELIMKEMLELQHRPPQTPGTLHKVIELQRSILMSHVPDDFWERPGIPEEIRERLRRVTICSSIVVPLRARGRVLGALGIGSGPSGRIYTPEDLAVVEELALRCALAIDNAWLFRRAELAAQRASRLQTITAALSRAPTSRQIAAVMRDQVVVALDASASLVALLNSEGTYLELIEEAGFQEGALSRWRTIPLDLSLPSSMSFRERRVVTASSPAEASRVFTDSGSIPTILGAIVGIPLMRDDCALGSVAVRFPTDRYFSSDDLEFMAAIGRQCAQALERARLYEAEQAARSEAQEATRREAAAADRLLETIREKEEALALLDVLFDAAPVGLGFGDRDMRFVRVNREMAAMDRVAPEDHIGRPIGDVLPEIESSIRRVFEKVMESGEPQIDLEIETWHTPPRASQHHWLYSLYPVRLRGESIGVGAVIKDITDRKRMENTLRLQADAWRLFNTSQDYIATLQSLTQLAVNHLAAVCTVVVIEPDGTLKRAALACADPGLHDQIRKALESSPQRQVNPTLSAVLMEGRPRLILDVPDGMLDRMLETDTQRRLYREIKPGSGMIVPLLARGAPIGALCLVSGSRRRYDEQDLQAAEELAGRASLALDNTRLYFEARRQSERVKALAEASRILAEAKQDEHQVAEKAVQYASEYVGDVAGIRMLAEDGLLLTNTALYHPDPEARAFLRELLGQINQLASESLVASVLETGEPLLVPVLTREEAMARLNPVYFPWIARYGLFSILVVPLRVHGHVFGTLTVTRDTPNRPYTQEDMAFLQDLADRAALALETAHQFRLAREALELRDEFLSAASHELKTPLTSLLAQTQMLLRGALRSGGDEKHISRLKGMEYQVHRLARLVNTLLDVSRIMADRLHLEIEHIDLRELTREVIDQFSDELSRAGCTWSLEAPEPVPGRWDRLRLEQVVANLLTNAAKYGRGGQVTIFLENAGDRVRLSVQDQGIGIDEQDQARIFQRFERAAAVQSYGGVGVGLWIVRQIVEALGGSVSVSSKLGAGALFTVELPREVPT